MRKYKQKLGAEMAKSLRSKRKKRLRSLRRVLVEPLEARKAEARQKVMDRNVAAPPAEIRVTAPETAEGMAVQRLLPPPRASREIEMTPVAGGPLAPTGGIAKAKKKKVKGYVTKKREKKAKRSAEYPV